MILELFTTTRPTIHPAIKKRLTEGTITIGGDTRYWLVVLLARNLVPGSPRPVVRLDKGELITPDLLDMIENMTRSGGNVTLVCTSFRHAVAVFADVSVRQGSDVVGERVAA